jgi:competence protein ComEA
VRPQSKPSPGRSPTPSLVNINTAGPDELETLPLIGTTMAARIIVYRQQNGPFKTVEDLMNVSGIGESALERLRPLITIGP